MHTALDPGLLESVYEVVLTHELKALGLEVRNQVGIPFIYSHIKFEIGFRFDIFVNNKVIIEIKSVEALQDVHHKQLLIRLANAVLAL